jgi:hypothetical protein
MQVHQIGLALAVVLCQFTAQAGGGPSDRVPGRVAGAEAAAGLSGQEGLEAPPDCSLLKGRTPDHGGVVGLVADGAQF